MQNIALLIDGEIEALVRLVSLMEQEQEALKTAKPETLSTLGDEKADLIKRLNFLEMERIDQIGATPGSDPKSAMTHWLDGHPAEIRVKSSWHSLLELARQAKALNELNGKLVAMHLERTEQALNALTPQRSNSGLYSSSGQATGLSGSRIIDSA